MKQVRPSPYSLSLFTFVLASFFPGMLAAASAQEVGFQVINQAPVVIQGQSNQPRRANASAGARPSMASEPVVEGFADQVPISVALQQILPQGYGYTLGDGVDPGQLVSWRGGRPWQTVLQNMLGPSGLAYSVNGRSINVSSVSSSPTIISGAPPQPVMQPPPQSEAKLSSPGPSAPYMPQQQTSYTAYPPSPPVQIAMEPQPPPQPIMMPQPPYPQPMMQPMMPPPQMPPPMPGPQMTGIPTPQPLQIENPLVYQPMTWDAHPGQTLRTLLQDWCARVGAELRWQAEYDYPVMATMNMTGTFEEAVRTLLSGFDSAKPTPRGRLHMNPAAGQSILIVEASGNNYGE